MESVNTAALLFNSMAYSRQQIYSFYWSAVILEKFHSTRQCTLASHSGDMWPMFYNHKPCVFLFFPRLSHWMNPVILENVPSVMLGHIMGRQLNNGQL